MKHKLIQLTLLILITTFIWQVLVIPTPLDGSSGDRSKIRNGDRSEFSFENVPKILRPRAFGEGRPAGNEAVINFDAFKEVKEGPARLNIPFITDKEDKDCLEGGTFYRLALEGQEDKGGFKGIRNIFDEVRRKEKIRKNKVGLEAELIDINHMATVSISERPDGKKYIAINKFFIATIAYLLKNGYNNITVRDPMEAEGKEGYPERESRLVTSIVYSIAIHEIRAHLKKGLDERAAQHVRGEGYRTINIAAMLYYWSLVVENVTDDILQNFLEDNYFLIGGSAQEADSNRLYYIEEWKRIEKERKDKNIPKPPLCKLYSEEWDQMTRIYHLQPKPDTKGVKEDEEMTKEERRRASAKVAAEKERISQEGEKLERIRKQRAERLRDNLHIDTEWAIIRWIDGRWNPLDYLVVEAKREGLDDNQLAKRINVGKIQIKNWKQRGVSIAPKSVKKIADAFGQNLCFVSSGIDEKALMDVPTYNKDDIEHRKLLGLKITVLMYENGLTARDLGIDNNQISRYKNGEVFPTDEDLEKIAKASKISCEELLGIKATNVELEQPFLRDI